LYTPSTTPMVMLLLEKCPGFPASEKFYGLGTVSCKIYLFVLYCTLFSDVFRLLSKAIIKANIKCLQKYHKIIFPPRD
jgi:hypothetical protein